MQKYMMYFKAQVSYKLMAIFFVFVCFLFAIIPIVAKDCFCVSQDGKNLIFTQIINYTIPTIDATTLNKDTLSKSSFSAISILKNFTGIDLSSPYSIMGSEIASLGFSNNIINNGNNNLSSSEFVLNDKDISKCQVVIPNSSIHNTNVNIYNPKLKGTLNTAKPEVLIYHSHTTESYKPGSSFNFDDTQNVVSVGDSIVSELQNGYAISAINDRTVHNVPDYNGSYGKSRITVGKYLQKFGDFKIIIDLHRDSIENHAMETVKMNGENVATFDMIMPHGNPHFAQNMKIANFIAAESNKLYPGLCHGIDTHYNKGIDYYNQDMSNNSILLEVGSDINTTAEANATAKYIARLIAEYLNGIK